MLYTWEDKFTHLIGRVVAVELELPRIRGNCKIGEGLQDRVNRRVAQELVEMRAILRQM